MDWDLTKDESAQSRFNFSIHLSGKFPRAFVNVKFVHFIEYLKLKLAILQEKRKNTRTRIIRL